MLKKISICFSKSVYLIFFKDLGAVRIPFQNDLTMILSLEELTQILAKVGISSSLEEEIVTATEILITPPAMNKESTYEESCTSDDEQSCE